MRFVNDVNSPDFPCTGIHELIVRKCVTKVSPSDYNIVICAANYVAVRLREIPPMGSLGSVKQVGSPPAVKFYAEAMKNKSIIKGALCHALWILTPHPKLLRGRKMICHTVVLADVVNAGAIYAPKDVLKDTYVVVDGDLVTGRSIADLEPYFNAMVEATQKV